MIEEPPKHKAYSTFFIAFRNVFVIFFIGTILSSCANPETDSTNPIPSENKSVNSAMEILPFHAITVSSNNDTTFFTNVNHVIESTDDIYSLHLFPTENAGLVDTVPIAIFKLKNLQELRLNDCMLKHLPEEIGQLKNLVYLDLSNNQLTELPSEIGNLEKLDTLLHDFNFELKSLPIELGNLDNLRHLNISLCWTIHFPPAICELDNLVFLNAMKTGLDSIPSCISRLEKLETLYINNNPISELPKEFGQLKNLRELWLINTDVTEFPDELSGLTNLRYFWIWTDNRMKARLNHILPNAILDKK